jgi:hypothetical protein
MSETSEDVSSEYFETIGAISVRFVFLERMLLSTISNCMGINLKLINLLISSGTFDSLRMTFERVFIYFLKNYKIKDNKLKCDFKQLVKKLEKANRERNDILHSFWYKDIPNNVVTRHQYRRSINIENKKAEPINQWIDVDIQSLKNTLKMISDLINELGTFRDKIVNLISTKD